MWLAEGAVAYHKALAAGGSTGLGPCKAIDEQVEHFPVPPHALICEMLFRNDAVKMDSASSKFILGSFSSGQQSGRRKLLLLPKSQP